MDEPQVLPDDEPEPVDDELAGGGAAAPARSCPVPGPQETLYEEAGPQEVLQTMPPAVGTEPPVEYPDDWLIDGLTPALRARVMKSFDEAYITEQKYVPALGKYVGARFYQASKSFIPVFVRPQGRLGSYGAAPLPVTYNIPKVDVVCFLKEQQDKLRSGEEHADSLRNCVYALEALLAKGMRESDAIEVMLPYDYEERADSAGALLEAESPLFADISGRNVVFIVDCSGAASKHLAYIKAAVKRALWTQVPHKQRFNLVTFTSTSGSVRDFAGALVPPTQECLERAEQWIDGLRPGQNAAGRGATLDALRLALAYKHTDSVVFATGGTGGSGPTPGFVLQGVRALNVTGASLHVVALDAPAGEVAFLRRLAEDNRGTFTARPLTVERGDGKEILGTFEQRYSSWRTGLVNDLARKREEGFRKARLTIGGQLRILQVMLEEHETTVALVGEEIKCGLRLIAMVDRPAAFPGSDKDQLKDLQRDMKRSSSVRVGGGYIYEKDGPDDKGLDTFFEVKSAVPWTVNSETVAIGPKFVPANPGVGATRVAKLPPNPTPLEPGTLPPAAPRGRKTSPTRKGASARPSSTTGARRPAAATRQASADRAAGAPRSARAPAPKPKKARAEEPPPPPPPPRPPIQRAWSF